MYLKDLEHLESGLKSKLEKCKFLADEVKYLGHVVTGLGVRPDCKKIECIKKWPTPKTVYELHSFFMVSIIQ
jgi:hypothetical protein